MFRWFRWRMAKRRLASLPRKVSPEHVRVSRQAHLRRVEDFPANAEGYERLASVWSDYARWFVSGYERFLVSAGSYYGVPIKAVLDLACGTGVLTRRLARRFVWVVGLDSSEAMLREAHSQTSDTNVRFVRGDFRNFRLEETFDAVVCSSDSLNHVQTPDEVTEVFCRVGRHLRPGGLFGFDVLDHQAFQTLVGCKTIAEVHGEKFEVYSFYDPQRRISETRVVFPGVIERHRRIPIEQEDVRVSGEAAGLEVVEAFSTPEERGYYLRRFSYQRQFYLLRRS